MAHGPRGPPGGAPSGRDAPAVGSQSPCVTTPRRGPPDPAIADGFGALVDAAASDDAAAQGLVDAYAGLDRGRRAALIDAVVTDAGHLGARQNTLLLLLAAGTDRDLAQVLAGHLFDAAPGGAPGAGARALRGSGGDAEALFLVRPLHGGFVETAALSWSRPDGRVATARVDPLCRDDDAERGLASLPDGLVYERLPFDEAADGLGRALWTHRRRHGAWPLAARRVAAFLCG